ncbi:MAG TPA: MobA/MobL family protein [Rhodanobacteraceae bacterium]|nr:MobA/MobL family protein [Rhodanobacteraceae bacterium]
MTPHARPHIETHNRSRGHSAVAGAAYRLGLALLDARTGTRHAYARRRRGGEIVAAFTVAPDGAPPWATDPAQCWNRAEAAERRKDAQVARDYRMPVPLGLDDQAAAAMARDMAQHIAARFAVPVSVGVHRDNRRDVLGRDKPAEKRGLHAHLYFPTRRLEGDHYGPKLSELSNKTTSAPLVDALNQHWAALANAYTARAGLVADYDHRAHACAGDGDGPMPTLGAAACAMERRGFATDKGDDMKLLERLRTLRLAAPQTGTGAATEPTTTTKDGGGQAAGAASPPARASGHGIYGQRRRAREALRVAERDEAVRAKQYTEAKTEAERRGTGLARWLTQHPRPFWLFWRRRRVWAAALRTLTAAAARQHKREAFYRHAVEVARRAVKKASEEVERTQRLEPARLEPQVRTWRPERPRMRNKPIAHEPKPEAQQEPKTKPPRPPVGALARRLRMVGLLPLHASAPRPEAPRTDKRRRPA